MIENTIVRRLLLLAGKHRAGGFQPASKRSSRSTTAAGAFSKVSDSSSSPASRASSMRRRFQN
jgi:hypothetical protein